jgi:glycosyltransferase involved in cell wall biosynthesis
MTTTVTVIPTIGANTLPQCVNSVLNQTSVDGVTNTCLVVVDGKQHATRVNELLHDVKDRVELLVLPYNTGSDGYYGHRIYSTIGALINQDYIFYCDEDNWFDSDHIETQLNTIKRDGATWSYSLRKIHNLAGEYLCDDNCESLGLWPVHFNDGHFLVDTSSYCLSREVAFKIGPAWLSGPTAGKWGSDRQFYANARHFFNKFSCTGNHTLNYRLGGNERSVTPDFFFSGNAKQLEKYPDGFPWHDTNGITI